VRGSPLELTLTPSSIGLPKNISDAAFRAELERAAEAWSSPQISCAGLSIKVGPSASLRTSWQDGVNAIMFRTDVWCHNARCGGLRTFPSLASAMTTPYAVRPVGSVAEPMEADIELNAVNYAWQATAVGAPEVGARAGAPIVSLRAALVHELGHVLGFADRCLVTHARHTLAVDPQCTSEERASVMFVAADG
jgi:hypothetical protein